MQLALNRIIFVDYEGRISELITPLWKTDIEI
jgi:hypothetical protein